MKADTTYTNTAKILRVLSVLYYAVKPDKTVTA
jgi:hypothetical protein